jgi:hypothetical protein
MAGRTFFKRSPHMRTELLFAIAMISLSAAILYWGLR